MCTYVLSLADGIGDRGMGWRAGAGGPEVLHAFGSYWTSDLIFYFCCRHRGWVRASPPGIQALPISLFPSSIKLAMWALCNHTLSMTDIPYSLTWVTGKNRLSPAVSGTGYDFFFPSSWCYRNTRTHSLCSVCTLQCRRTKESLCLAFVQV